MKFQKAELEGIWLIDLEKIEDERGYLARTWCRYEFESHGLNPQISQCSLVYNEKVGTLRGMHYQHAPYSETKTIFCSRGAIYDVVIDLRLASQTFSHWMAVELSEHKPQILYIPEGFAHGYQTLTDHTEILYQMSTPYAPQTACGVRWNDPAFKITWPSVPSRIISQKDQHWPDFEQQRANTHASF